MRLTATDGEIARLKKELEAALQSTSRVAVASTASPLSPVASRAPTASTASVTSAAAKTPEVQRTSSSSSMTNAAPALTRSPSAARTFSSLSPKCEICGKSVYHAEKYMDSSKIYHAQ